MCMLAVILRNSDITLHQKGHMVSSVIFSENTVSSSIWAAMFFLQHPYIWATTEGHDTEIPAYHIWTYTVSRGSCRPQSFRMYSLDCPPRAATPHCLITVAMVRILCTIDGNCSLYNGQISEDSNYSQTQLVSTWITEYSWIVSTHSSVPTSCNTIENTLDNKYLW
jgi:hypothetical protein